MLRRYSFLPILILAALLAGCAPKAIGHPDEVRALENPTSTALPEPPATPEITESESVPHAPPPSCPVTTPQDPVFVPPSPYDTLGVADTFWYGSSSLWTAIPRDSTWAGLPYNQHGYTQKVFWWREGYVWNEEPEPALTITAERLKEIGLEGFAGPVKVTCEDHNGHHSAYMQQWDGQKWVKASDWIAPMKDKVRPLLEAASKDYVSKDAAWPKRTEPCDKSS